jgi:hypothetical protein
MSFMSEWPGWRRAPTSERSEVELLNRQGESLAKLGPAFHKAAKGIGCERG